MEYQIARILFGACNIIGLLLTMVTWFGGAYLQSSEKTISRRTRFTIGWCAVIAIIAFIVLTLILFGSSASLMVSCAAVSLFMPIGCLIRWHAGIDELPPELQRALYREMRRRSKPGL